MDMQEYDSTGFLQALYAEHSSWLATRIRNRLGCMQQAQDVVQEIFLKLLSSYDSAQWSSVREPRSFLMTIAKRVIVDRYRRSKRESHCLDVMQVDPVDDQASPEYRYYLAQTLKNLDVRLDKVGGRAKEAFILSQLYGFKYNEIAAHLCVSVSSVNQYMARATGVCLMLVQDGAFL